MWLFGRRKRQEKTDKKEAEIQAIRQETLNKIEEASRKTEKVNKLLDEHGGTTYLIFLATGGERRKHGKR